MEKLEEMWNPEAIQERMDHIDRHRGDLSIRFRKMSPGNTIPEPELIRDAQLRAYYEAWKKLNKINEDIANGMRDANGDVRPGA